MANLEVDRLSFTSGKKRLYDILIERLNSNSLGVEFSGNFMFRFWQQGTGINEFEIMQKEVDEEGNPLSLEFTQKEVVPVVDIQSIEIPFVERNKRSDWEKEYYIAIRVEYKVNEFNQRVIEFDEDDVKYQALLESLATIGDNLLFTKDGYKYAFKVKEPSDVNIFKYSGNYYQILAVGFTLTSIEQGYFGNETQVYLAALDDTNFGLTNDYRLDFTDVQVLLSKETTVLAPVELKEHKVHINKRHWSARITINYLGNVADNLLKEEVHGLVEDNRKKYQIRFKRGDGTKTSDYDYVREVYVTNANVIYATNSVVNITFDVERV